MKTVELDEETHAKGYLLSDGRYCAVGALLSQVFNVSDDDLAECDSHNDIPDFVFTLEEGQFYSSIYVINDLGGHDLDEKVRRLNELCEVHDKDFRFEVV